MSLSNDISVEWKQSSIKHQFPAREGQCSCVHEQYLYIFGGVLQGRDAELTESNDLLRFDADKEVWEKLATKGSIPPPRISASLVSVGKKLYLFGGLSHMAGWYDDFYIYDIDTLTWTAVVPEGQGPSSRDKLQACAIDHLIYYFGGFGPKFNNLDEEEWEDDDEDNEDLPDDQEGAEFGWFNDLFVYDTTSNKWSQPMQMNLGVPSPRAAHGMCAIGKKLVIFGGKDMEGRQNDIYIFDTETRKWETDLSVKGQLPEARSFHSTTAVGNRVVVLGGRGVDDQHFADFHIFDTVTKEWLQPNVSGSIPLARGQHSVGLVKNSLVLFGGTTNFSKEIMQCQDFLTDTYYLTKDAILNGEKKVQSNGDI